ncbi:helix-turn-helix domain-containing protein [Hymenobacter actinosclerus]|nr:helix-turn-helix domain-containing protein [Hymenobacter actinosclerus]
MASLSDLRMQKHALSMRQMVAEIHLGKLNIAQAAAKFELTRKTVRHWIDLVEAEAEANGLPPAPPPCPPGARKRTTRPAPQDSEAVEALTAKIQALEAALETANFKALYYTTLLRVAEEELGIDIEKKSVTKPSAAC